MPIVQNLYQVYKIPTGKIIEAKLSIENYTKKQAIREGSLVSIGDNLLLHKIRDCHHDNRNHVEIFNLIQELRKTLKMCKKQGKINEARIVNQQISDILFVKDIVIVSCEKKGDYRALSKGFYVNGVKFIRFCAGAGNLRRDCAIFINARLYDYLYEALMCGLSGKMKTAVLPKLGAYFALSFSSVLWVREPRVCIIKDFENIIPQQKVDYIVRNDAEHKIEERIMDLALNCADGQGLIDPSFSTLWAEDMFLDYVPSSFVVRSAFIKGNLVPFDFKAYAAEHDIAIIKDKWGYEYNIEDVDVLISESQFKLHKQYSSWQEYLKYSKKYNLRWGVARYNKKHDDEYVLANYQYIQTLNITSDDIKELVAPTVSWLQKICSGEDLYTLLFMFGAKNEEVTYQTMYGSAQANFSKAVVKNSDFLRDGYIQHKIYKSIATCINQAKIGKIWVRGNYQFSVSDPISQCRSALGLAVFGEVPANHVYSNFWNERQAKGTLDFCRSPLIDTHEHNPLELYESEMANKWYKYIKSGVIFSIYDTSTFRMSDSDHDGDIILSTDNPIFIKGSQKHQNIITYDKGTPIEEVVSIQNFIKKDLMGFGTAVGSFSNCATILYSMIGIFTKPEQEGQRQELHRRIKLLREYVGQEIDRAKLGIKKPQLPSHWKRFERVYQDDTDAVKSEKYRHNSMVISKKPYFFRYLYPELNRQYKHYESAYNIISKDVYGIKFKKLLTKADKTEDEKTLVRRYQKFSPLIVSNCTMNTLCREFENIDFDIRFKNNYINYLPTFEDEGYIVDEEKLNKIRDLYRQYNNKKSVKYVDSIFDNLDDEDIRELRFNVMDTIKTNIQEDLFRLDLEVEEIMFHIGQLAKEYSKFNWSFAWDILEDYIVGIIPQGKTYSPIKNEHGQEYLGDFYSLKEVTKVVSEGEDVDE